MEKKLISTREAMGILKLSYDGFYRLVLNERFKTKVRKGNKSYFDLNEVESVKAERNAKYASL